MTFTALRTISLAVSFALVSPLAQAQVQGAPTTPASCTYRVQQKVTLSDISENAAKVRWWIAIPSDHRGQEVLDFAVVAAPGKWSIVRDVERSNRLLYVEVDRPAANKLETTVVFTLRRAAIDVVIDPSKVGELQEEQRLLYTEELRLDSPHMEATPVLSAIADKVCGDEKNIAIQASKLLEWVAANADHYSKDATKPNCGIGDAAACMKFGGGCCTDLHSLFIALARARGIPARLEMGYRLQAKNVGLEVDPGYRCWPEYMVPGYGWVPADIVEADAAGGADGLRWYTGLSERRLWLNSGREFQLLPKQDGPPVNTLSIGYAEIDGKPARVLPEGDLLPQLTRKVQFTEIASGQSAALTPPESKR